MSSAGSTAPGDVDDVVVGERAHHLADRVRLADVGEELVAQALALARALDDAGDVDERDRRRDDPLAVEDLREDVEARVGQRRRRRRSARSSRTGSSPRAPRALVSALNRVDLPTLGRPTMPMVSATTAKAIGRPTGPSGGHGATGRRQRRPMAVPTCRCRVPRLPAMSTSRADRVACSSGWPSAPPSAGFVTSAAGSVPGGGAGAPNAISCASGSPIWRPRPTTTGSWPPRWRRCRRRCTGSRGRSARWNATGSSSTPGSASSSRPSGRRARRCAPRRRHSPAPCGPRPPAAPGARSSCGGSSSTPACCARVDFDTAGQRDDVGRRRGPPGPRRPSARRQARRGRREGAARGVPRGQRGRPTTRGGKPPPRPRTPAPCGPTSTPSPRRSTGPRSTPPPSSWCASCPARRSSPPPARPTPRCSSTP